MDFATRNWFGYINENIRLDEGLRDIGLSEFVADAIDSALHQAPESAKTWLGHRWKTTHLHQFVRPSNRIQEFRFNTMEPLLSALDYWTGGTKKEDLDEPKPEVQFGAPHSGPRPPWGWGPIAEARLTEEETEAEMEARVTKRTENLADRAKHVKFVLQTINKTIKDEPLGKWNKAFKKAVKRLSKLGLNSKAVDFVKGVLDNAIEQAWASFSSRFQDVFTFLNMHPDNIRILSDIENMADADNKAEEEIAEQEDPDQILHTFDDGSYWYDLQTSNCDLEGERMGHCGAAQSGGTMYSLRKPEGKRGKSKSFVTIEFDGEIVSQIKGRSNSMPPEIMWPHIEWFIDNMGVTEVTEQGEHSDDPEAFMEMNAYLEQKTSANFSGNRQTRVDELESELENIDQNIGYDNELVHSAVYYNISDYGEDDNQIYVEAGCECGLQIDLGWPLYFQAKKGYIAMDKDGNPITSYPMIPTTYSEQSSFESDVGIDEVAASLPGEEADINISMAMMQGVIPDDWEPPADFPNAEYPETAHLIVEIRRSETFEDTEREGGSSAARDYEYFASEVVDAFEERYHEHVKTIQRKLAVEDYIAKNAYVKDMSKLEKISELKHWKVHVDDENAQFTFIDDRDGDLVYRLRTGLAVPTETVIYLTAGERSGPTDLIRRMFPNLNIRGAGGELRGQSLNSQMAHNLQGAYKEAQAALRAASDQEQLDFGDKYAPDPIMELAKDIELIIYPNVKHDVREMERVPTITFDFTFLVRVSYDDNVEEIDRVLAMLHYVNDNPEIPREAVREIILPSMSAMKDVTWARQKKLEMSNTVTSFFQQMDSVYGAQADAGDDIAERFMLISMWLRDTWEQMDLLERFVADKVYIEPMLARTFRGHSMAGAIDVDTGKPRNWDEYVQKERVRRGVGLASKDVATARDEMNRLGASVTESIEEQIARIDALLNEKESPIDLRIYKTQIGCSVDTSVGGAEMEIETQIRGIDGVTTVRSQADSKRPLTSTNEYMVFEIKFELMGASSRKEYREAVLFPGLRRISGLNIIDWTSIHRTNVRGTIRTVREDIVKELRGGFGSGQGGPTSAHQGISQPLPTPKLSIQAVIEDWKEAGVQAYDAPMNTDDMRYHVMVSTEELWPFKSKTYRDDFDTFDTGYIRFISDGARLPVYLAVGQNGRAKITGNEDLVWFAKRAGLEELPVFISYQKQV